MFISRTNASRSSHGALDEICGTLHALRQPLAFVRTPFDLRPTACFGRILRFLSCRASRSSYSTQDDGGGESSCLLMNFAEYRGIQNTCHPERSAVRRFAEEGTQSRTRLFPGRKSRFLDFAGCSLCATIRLRSQ